MAITLKINSELCIKCRKCVRVCPSNILKQDEKSEKIEIAFLESCIVCGHCAAVCPENAIIHSEFPDKKVHPVDYSELPTPKQMMLLCKTRRSNRAFSSKPIPEKSLEMILEAAHRAPTGTNAQHVKFLIVTNPEKLHQITKFTIDVFEEMVKKVKKPLIKPLIKLILPNDSRYIPVFERILDDFHRGGDEILRRATAVIFVYTPKGTRMGCIDANLAYQNGSLMAESLGVGQFYTGFVLNASKIKKGKLEKMLGIDGEIHAGMALGVPALRYPKYIDRKDLDVIRML